MKPWIIKTLIGLLLVLAVTIAILCWITDSLMLVAGLGALFIADCYALNRLGELDIFESEEEND